MPLPGNMPRVIGIVGPYERARELATALATYEPIGFIDMDSPIHEALTDLTFPAGEGEDTNWSNANVEDTVLSLRHWAQRRWGPQFFALRAVDQVNAAGDSHSLYLIPNIRTLEEHTTFRTEFKSYEYMCIIIREGTWEPRVSDSWANIDNYVLMFEVGEKSLLTQLLETLDPELEGGA